MLRNKFGTLRIVRNWVQGIVLYLNIYTYREPLTEALSVQKPHGKRNALRMWEKYWHELSHSRGGRSFQVKGSVTANAQHWATALTADLKRGTKIDQMISKAQRAGRRW